MFYVVTTLVNMAVNLLSSVPKLKGRENYSNWAFAVKNMLVLDDLHGFLDGSATDAADTGKDGKAKAKLILTIDPSLYVHVKDAKKTKDLWTTLQKLFDDNGFCRKISLLRSLISIRLDSCDSMESYVTQLIETAQKLKGTGFNIDDNWIGSLLLAGLPEKYSPMIMAVEHSGINLTVDAIKMKLLDMEPTDKTGSAFVGGRKFHHRKFGNAGGANTSNGPGGSDNTDNVSSNLKNVRCYKCKQTGHYKAKCPNKSERKANAFSAAFLSGQFNNQDWYIDSGASAHLTVHKEWLENISSSVRMENIVTANNEILPVTCMGEIRITTATDNDNHSVIIKNAMCVPNLTTNLLSVSQLIENGNEVTFVKNGCKIFNSEKTLVAVADLVNNVYKLRVKENMKCLWASSPKASSEVWHRRFGHINYKDLCRMEAGIVDGMTFSTKRNSNECVTCCEGKQSRLPFSKHGTRAESLLQLVHADVCGPMESKSIGGSKYFLLFEDDLSRMTFVYFLKTKSEAFECFKDFKALVENQTGLRIKTLRSDNGGEFCGGNFEQFLKKSGIVHQKTNPHTPQQNGVIERMNRSIVQMAKCLLFDADLGVKFWAEAVNTAVYLKNRCIAAGLGDKTPFEVWHGKKPNVQNLKIFGSTAMVHVPKANRKKWEKKSTEMVLVGFGEDIKGYRVYDPTKGTITTSRDVIVMENTGIQQEDSHEEVKIVVKPVQVGETDMMSSGNDSMSVTSQDESDISSDSEYVPAQDSETSSNTEAAPETTLRRSTREAKPKNFNDYVTYMCSSSGGLKDPVTVTEALDGPEKDQWRAAMVQEYESFIENDAWQVVDAPEGANIVECKWVFKRKINSDNSVRHRARLVAKGFSQKLGIDYEETYSPVVRHSTLRLLIALAVNLDLKIYHYDVMTAFLHGSLNEVIFMKQPEGFKLVGSDNKVCKLNRAIYGLKQSSRVWYEKVDNVLTKMGYKRSELEHCVYVKSNGDSLTIVALYVDDFFVFSNFPEETSFLKSTLNSQFKLKDLGEARHCLGMNICRNHETGIITLDQTNYIDQILARFNMSNCKPASTPLEVNPDCNVQVGICNKDIPYQQAIGSLMYLAVLTRPDISFAVSYLSQFNNNFNESHWVCVKRVLKYLQNTKHYCLTFKKSDVNMEGYVDADWAGNKSDRRSYTGFIFKFSESAISWESRKQRTIALSSTEAEYMAISEAAKEAIYFKNLLYELTGQANSIKLFNDNMSAQKLAVSPLYHRRSKHIDIRHHFIREAISDKNVELFYLPTDQMIADVLTKSLTVAKHNRFVNDIGLVEVV